MKVGVIVSLSPTYLRIVLGPCEAQVTILWRKMLIDCYLERFHPSKPERHSWRMFAGRSGATKKWGVRFTSSGPNHLRTRTMGGWVTDFDRRNEGRARA